MLVKAKGDLQAITASRLTDGIAVWRTAEGTWAEGIAEAAVFAKADVAAALDAARADTAGPQVVDIYPLDVRVTDGRPEPVHVRERMKALGPTVHPAFGKQAETTPGFTL